MNVEHNEIRLRRPSFNGFKICPRLYIFFVIIFFAEESFGEAVLTATKYKFRTTRLRSHWPKQTNNRKCNQECRAAAAMFRGCCILWWHVNLWEVGSFSNSPLCGLQLVVRVTRAAAERHSAAWWFFWLLDIFYVVLLTRCFGRGFADAMSRVCVRVFFFSVQVQER